MAVSHHHSRRNNIMATQLRPFAIVTGASSGIGLELAKCCTENGFDVLIAADEPEIENVARRLRDTGATVQALQVDLATQEGVDALCAARALRPELSIVLVLPSETHNDNSFAQDAQQHNYLRLLAAGVEIYEYLNHFNHLKLAVFDERFSIHGSTNLNYRSLEDNKDFELVVYIDDRRFALRNLREVRDVDVRYSRRITERDVHGFSAGALRMRIRHPWTQLMLSRRVL
jgi:phosphatidylserine/phosphatidylglycerophosphate/cardiolipin synthase-like enzyme